MKYLSIAIGATDRLITYLEPLTSSISELIWTIENLELVGASDDIEPLYNICDLRQEISLKTLFDLLGKDIQVVEGWFTARSSQNFERDLVLRVADAMWLDFITDNNSILNRVRQNFTIAREGSCEIE